MSLLVLSKDPNFNFQSVKLKNGLEAVYLEGPNAEKIFWNQDGYQYMILNRSDKGAIDFYGPIKLIDLASTLKAVDEVKGN